LPTQPAQPVTAPKAEQAEPKLVPVSTGSYQLGEGDQIAIQVF